MLNEFLFTKIEEEDIGNIWFQQDGATCHTAEAKLHILRPIFEDRWIILRQIDLQKMPILTKKKKKSSFQIKLILILVGM